MLSSCKPVRGNSLVPGMPPFCWPMVFLIKVSTKSWLQRRPTWHCWPGSRREGSGLYLCGEKANSQGAIDLGILPQGNGLGAQAMLAAAAEGKLDALYVVAEDP